MVTLHTFALEKLDLLAVSLGKLNFSSVVIYLGEILSSGAWKCHENKVQKFPLTARANSNPKVTNQWTLVGGCVDDRTINF